MITFFDFFLLILQNFLHVSEKKSLISQKKKAFHQRSEKWCLNLLGRLFGVSEKKTFLTQKKNNASWFLRKFVFCETLTWRPSKKKESILNHTAFQENANRFFTSIFEFNYKSFFQTVCVKTLLNKKSKIKRKLVETSVFCFSMPLFSEQKKSRVLFSSKKKHWAI